MSALRPNAEMYDALSKSADFSSSLRDTFTLDEVMAFHQVDPLEGTFTLDDTEEGRIGVIEQGVNMMSRPLAKFGAMAADVATGMWGGTDSTGLPGSGEQAMRAAIDNTLGTSEWEQAKRRAPERNAAIDAAFPVPKAQTIPEYAAQAIGGVAGEGALIAGGGNSIPAWIMAGTVSGGQEGAIENAKMGTALKVLHALPLPLPARLAVESSGMFAYTYSHSGDLTESLVNGLLPVALSGPDIYRETRARMKTELADAQGDPQKTSEVVQKYAEEVKTADRTSMLTPEAAAKFVAENEAEALALVDRERVPSRAEFKRAGFDGRLSEADRTAFIEMMRAEVQKRTAPQDLAQARTEQQTQQAIDQLNTEIPPAAPDVAEVQRLNDLAARPDETTTRQEIAREEEIQTQGRPEGLLTGERGVTPPAPDQATQAAPARPMTWADLKAKAKELGVPIKGNRSTLDDAVRAAEKRGKLGKVVWIQEPTRRELAGQGSTIGANKPPLRVEAPAHMDLQGFASDLNPMRLAKIEAALSTNLKNGNRIIARKALVEEKVATGSVVKTAANGQRRLVAMDGSFLDEGQISKTAMDYAEHLVNTRDPNMNAETRSPMLAGDPEPKIKITAKDAETNVLQAYDRYKELIGNEDDFNYALSAIEAQHAPTLPTARYGFAFRDTPNGRSDANEVRSRLPKELQSRVKIVKQGDPAWSSADGTDWMGLAGADQLAQMVVNFKESQGLDPKAGKLRKTVEWIEQNPEKVAPEDFRAAIEWKNLQDPDLKKIVRQRGREAVSSDELGVGDTFEMAAEKFTVKNVDPDNGTVTVKDGIEADIPGGYPLIVDRGTLSKAEADTPFDSWTTESKTTNLLGERTFEPATGEQRTMEFGADTAGNQPTPQGWKTKEGMIRPEVNIEAEVRAAKEASANKQSFLDYVAQAETDAMGRLKSKLGGSTLFAGLDPEILKDLAIVGASKIIKGAVTTARFTKEMVDQFGEKIREHLPAIWEESRKRVQAMARPDLANPDRSPEGRTLVDVVDIRRNKAGKPELVRDASVREVGAAMVDRDPAAVERRMYEAAGGGAVLSPTEMAAVNELHNRLRDRLLRGGTPEEVVQMMKFVDAHREARGQWARTGRQMRDVMQSPAERMQQAITEQLLTPPEKTQAKIKEAEAKGFMEEAERLRKEYAKRFEELKRLLEQMGYKPEDVKNITDPAVLGQISNALSIAQRTVPSMLQEYFRNSILSPLSLTRNLTGNVGYGSVSMTLGRAVDTMIDSLARKAGMKSDGARWGEFRVLMKTLLPAMRQGWEAGRMSWRIEQPWFERSLGLKTENKWEHIGSVSIPGKLGRVVRIPQRVLLMTDDITKTTQAVMEVQARAYRIATNEGKVGAAKEARINELVQEPASAAWVGALEDVYRRSFQQEGGATAKQIKRAGKAIRQIPGMYYLAPFVETPVNILETGVKYSPIGVGVDLARALRTGDFKPFVGNVAKQAAAWGLLATAMSWTNPDDGRPLITGTEDKSNRMSVRIGGKYIYYGGLEPFATGVAMTVDMARSIMSGNAEAMLKAPGKSLVGQLQDKTFIRGISDLADAMKQPSMRSALQWAAQFGASWVPNFVRSPLRAMKDEVPERRVFEGPDMYRQAGKRLLQNTELWPFGDRPKWDVWGRPLKNATSPVPMTDIPWRILSPLRQPTEYTPFKGDVMIAAYNRLHPEDDWNPTIPDPYFEVRGKRVNMTADEYSEFLRIGGEIARNAVEKTPFNVDAPTRGAIERLKAILRKSHEIAKRQVLARRAAQSR